MEKQVGSASEAALKRPKQGLAPSHVWPSVLGVHGGTLLHGQGGVGWAGIGDGQAVGYR